MTITGSGSSLSSEDKAAATTATLAAVRRLNGAKPAYGFLFASPGHQLGPTLVAAREAAGCREIIGCTTAGEITEKGLVHNGVAVLLVASDTSSCKLGFAEGLKADPKRVADALQRGAAELKKAAPRDRRHPTTILLTDGLVAGGETLVNDLYDKSQSGTQIVGGAAGDEGQFKVSYVGAGDKVQSDAVAALHVQSASPWGVGVNHGLRSTTKQMRVTAATGNVVHEIDGEPAFNVYKRHAAERGVALTPENAGPYMIGNELGIHFFERIARARAPLSAAADGSLTCAAEIPKGSMVSILDGEINSMVQAAKSAAEEAKKRLEGGRAAGVLLFDCVCRGMILKDSFNREVEAVRSVFGEAPIAGFLTYGEIARNEARADGWHNATAVVVAIPA